MQVAILSDIHDNLPMLRKALERCQSAEVLICCGDLCSPFVAKELGQGFAKPIHVVFGNNDGDRFRIAANGAKFPQLQFHGEYVELDLGGKTFSSTISTTLVELLPRDNNSMWFASGIITASKSRRPARVSSSTQAKSSVA